MNNPIKKEKGVILVIVLLISVVLSIFVVTLTLLMKQEGRMIVKHKEASIASNLVEAGVNQGLWKINESQEIWTSALAGTPPVNYNGSHVFTDINGGKYKVKITPGPGQWDLTIKAVGMDASGKEKRGLSMVVGKILYEASYQIGGSLTATNSNFEAEWGPLKAATSIDLSGCSGRYYPRKYANGKIKPRDISSSPPNTDNTEYWAYGSGGTYQNGQVDLAKYKTAAKAYTTPTSAPSRSKAVPTGSGYYPSSAGSPLTFNNFVDDAGQDASGHPTIYYFDCDVKVTGTSFFKGTIIHMGNNLWFYGYGAKDPYYVAIPHDAPLEYKHANAVAHWNSTFKTYYDNGTPYPVPKCIFHGFLYVKKEFWDYMTYTCPPTVINNIVGIIYFDCDQEDIYGHTTIFYDPQVDEDNVGYKQSPAQRKSWHEFAVSSWDNPW